MGDRANVFIKNSYDVEKCGKGVYLYTHWGGHELAETVQAALKRDVRWDDDCYLARIIFCEMIKGQEGNEGGFGISPYMGDNEHKIIVVDCGKQEIGFAKEGDEPDCLVRWSFKNFCALPVMELNAEYLHIA